MAEAKKPAAGAPLGDVVITLVDPIEGHNGLVRKIVLRPPAYREVMSYGEPFAQGFSRDGGVVYQAENVDAIRAYAEALIRRPSDIKEPHLDAGLIEGLSITDTLQLKGAILGFFSAARSKLSGGT